MVEHLLLGQARQRPVQPIMLIGHCHLQRHPESSNEKVANRTVLGFRGDRSRGRFAMPADFPHQDCSPYRGLHVRCERLGFDPLSRTNLCRPVPNPNRPIRNFCIAGVLSGGPTQRPNAQRSGHVRGETHLVLGCIPLAPDGIQLAVTQMQAIGAWCEFLCQLLRMIALQPPPPPCHTSSCVSPHATVESRAAAGAC